MQRIIIILILFFTFLSCGSARNRGIITTKKQQTTKKTRPTETIKSNTSLASKIIKNAKNYTGTPYKYGGNTKSGIDCSGLIHNAFKEENQQIPRVSSTMAKTGHWVDLKKVQKGDLLFFATKKGSRKVNHVGLVTAVNANDIEFIHATTSKGVTTSKLKEKYWYFAFVQARRLL